MQMALFNCISYLLNRMVNEGEISICPQKKGSDCSVIISFKGEGTDKSTIFKDASSSEELLSLNSIVESLNGIYELDESNNAIIIKIASIN